MNKFRKLLLSPVFLIFVLVFINIIVLTSLAINLFATNVSLALQIFPETLPPAELLLKFIPTIAVAFTLSMLLYFLIKYIQKQIVINEHYQFQRLANTLNDILWIIDVKTRKSTYVSEACRRHTGWTPEEYCAMTLNEKFTPETCRTIDISLTDIEVKLNSGYKSVEAMFDGQQYTRWGNLNYVEISAVITKNKNENVYEIFGITRIINDRKQLELQLRESEAKYQFIARNIKDLIVVSDYSTLCYTYVSDSSLQVLGYEPEEMLGKHWKIFTAPEYYEPLMAHLYDPVERYNKGDIGALHTQFETKKIHKDGHLVWVENSGNILLDENNHPKTVVTTMRRIDDRKRAELQIQQQKEALAIANKTKERFFSIISHDLKNPIASLHQMGEMLNTDFAAVAAQSENPNSREITELKDDINLLNEAAAQAHKLLENLLAWARSSMNAIVYKPAQRNLIQTIDECCRHLAAQANVKNITIEAPSAGAEVQANYDDNLILTVVRNLVSNAIKFSFNNSVIKVKVADFAENSDFVVVSVTDSGTGMSEEILSKLFNIDEKIMSVGTGGESGTGLGLILCKEFVEKHGGNIWAESKEGEGSTFLFTLSREPNK